MKKESKIIIMLNLFCHHQSKQVLVHKLFTIILNAVVDSNQTEHYAETENKTKNLPQAEPGINGSTFIINDLK